MRLMRSYDLCESAFLTKRNLNQPVMSTVDRTFLHGRVGVGSFDDMGDFDVIRLWGKRHPSGRLHQRKTKRQ